MQDVFVRPRVRSWDPISHDTHVCVGGEKKEAMSEDRQPNRIDVHSLALHMYVSICNTSVKKTTLGITGDDFLATLQHNYKLNLKHPYMTQGVGGE